jgi:hypothetical protein
MRQEARRHFRADEGIGSTFKCLEVVSLVEQVAATKSAVEDVKNHSTRGISR